MLRILAFGCILLVLPGIALSKDKPSSKGDALREEAQDRAGLDDKQTGPGRPDDPGAHGRENAAQKQAQNPGKGSKGDDQRLRYDIEDDRKDREKDKDKDRDMDEQGEKRKQKEKSKSKDKAGKD